MNIPPPPFHLGYITPNLYGYMDTWIHGYAPRAENFRMVDIGINA